MPERRESDRFNPEPMPSSVKEYRERTWSTMQALVTGVSQMNGRVATHAKRLVVLEKTDWVLKFMAKSLVVLIPVGLAVVGWLRFAGGQ